MPSMYKNTSELVAHGGPNKSDIEKKGGCHLNMLLYYFFCLGRVGGG